MASTTSEARMRANRQNAKRSTGPKTSQGKARASKNAVKHGLNVAIHAQRRFAERRADLAKLIAGPDPSPKSLEIAARVAEAQLDLERVRAVRKSVLEESLVMRSGGPLSSTSPGAQGDKDVRLGETKSSLKPSRAGPSAAHGEIEFSHDLDRREFRRRIDVLDRYERRALSRRRQIVETLTQTFGSSASACLAKIDRAFSTPEPARNPAATRVNDPQGASKYDPSGIA